MKEKKKSRPRQNLPAGMTTGTFIIKEEYLEKIKNAAYTDRRTITATLGEILEQHFKNRKKKILKRPKK